LDRTIYIRCVYGNFGREITIYTVIYGVYIRFWPTLHMVSIKVFGLTGIDGFSWRKYERKHAELKFAQGQLNSASAR